MTDVDKARKLVGLLKMYLEGAQTWAGPRRERIDEIVKKLEEALI